MSKEFETLKINCDNGIAVIELNRPESMNAFGLTSVMEFIEAIDRLGKDDRARVIVVTAAGTHFCAGADLSGGAESFDAGEELPLESEQIRDRAGLITLKLFDCPKPLIAAVQGAAVGIGATMTLAMDYRIASSDARFGFVFTRRGIVPEGCSTWFLPRIVGLPTALDWLLTGRFVGAQEALDAKLVSKIVEREQLKETALELAAMITTQTSSISVALTRQMVWKLSAAEHPMAAHRIESRGVYALGRSAEAREGVGAFLEKRPPEFVMKVSSDMPDFYPWWVERAYT